MTPRKPKVPQKPKEAPTPEEEQVTKCDTDSDTVDDRTVFLGEYRGGKVKIFFGKKGTVITWALAWSIALLSVVLAAGMVVTILENLKRIGVLK